MKYSLTRWSVDDRPYDLQVLNLVACDSVHFNRLRFPTRKMPSRVSAKSARSSAATTKARQSNNEADVPDEGPFNALRNQICGIFADAQRSNTGHRKLVVGLRKVQEACCYEPANPRNNSCEEEFDEVEFNEEVSRCSLRILPVKKSEPAGDRVLKFLGLFLKHAAEAGKDCH